MMRLPSRCSQRDPLCESHSSVELTFGQKLHRRNRNSSGRQYVAEQVAYAHDHHSQQQAGRDSARRASSTKQIGQLASLDQEIHPWTCIERGKAEGGEAEGQSFD